MANTHANNINAISVSGIQAYRSSILYFTNDPAFHQQAYAWHEDGLLIIEDGKVLAAGDYTALKNTYRKRSRCTITAARSSCPASLIPIFITRRQT